MASPETHSERIQMAGRHRGGADHGGVRQQARPFLHLGRAAGGRPPRLGVAAIACASRRHRAFLGGSVGDRRFDQGKAAAVVKVDIVRMSVARAGHAKLEAHWHITDLDVGLDTVGGESFDVPLSGSDYAAVAQAYSQALSQLADRLVAALPAHGG